MSAPLTLIVLLGPTASGKTSLAIDLAKKLNTEIISCDSRQVFKEMNIGVARPTPEELAAVPHHLIAHKSIQDSYSAGQFEREAMVSIEYAHQKSNYAILAGGSMLYAAAVSEGMDEFPAVNMEIRKEVSKMDLDSLRTAVRECDPEYYSSADIDNPRRLMRALEVYRTSGRPYSSFKNKAKAPRPFKTITIGISREREEIYERINQRVDQMMADGLEEEARALLPFRPNPALDTVGYQELFPYFEGQYDKEEAVRLIKRNTRRFAKRQMTWLRGIQDLNWIVESDFEQLDGFIRFMAGE